MMEDLIKASKAGEPIAVLIRSGPGDSMTRICAEIFEVQGGVAFIDIGWNNRYGNPGHAAHIIDGKIDRLPSGEWRITEEEIGREFYFFLISRGDIKELSQWQAWEKAKHEQGKKYDRERAWSLVESIGGKRPGTDAKK